MDNYFGIRSRINIVVAHTVALGTVVICNEVSPFVTGLLIDPTDNCGVDAANKISNAFSVGDAEACCAQIVDVGSACICGSDSIVLSILGELSLTELAHGLELSEIPFLWAFREPKSTGGIKLPHGFEERTEGRGIVWKGWVPQLKIHDHDSVGGFLTHCGLGSTLEALMFGAPLILLPLMLDQWSNSRILVEKQIGVEVERKEEDGSFTRQAVALAVRLVMVEDGGKKFRDKAKEAGAVFGNRRLHDSYVEDFIDYLEHERF